MDRMVIPTAPDIKNRRQRIGVSQGTLAKEAGVSYRTVLRLEKGSRQIREEKVEQIIRALERLEQSGQKPGPWWLYHKRMLETDGEWEKRK